MSSRDGGCLLARADTAARITALNVVKGHLQVENVTIDVSNGNPSMTDKSKQSAACITLGATATMDMSRCRLVCHSSNGVVGVSGSKNNYPDVKRTIRNTEFILKAAKSVYGVNVYSHLSADHVRIQAYADSVMAYGIAVPAGAEAVLNDVDLDVRCGKETAYGIYAVGSKTGTPRLNIRQVSVSVAGQKKTTGITTYPDFWAERITIQVHADSLDAKGIVINNYADTTALYRDSCYVRHAQLNVTAYKSAYGMQIKGRVHIDSTDIQAHADHEVANAIQTYHHTRLNHCQLSAYSRYYNAMALSIAGSYSDCSTVEATATRCTAITDGAQAYAAYLYKGDMVANVCAFQSEARQDTITMPADAKCTAVYVYKSRATRLTGCQLVARVTNETYGQYAHALYQSGTAVLDSCTLLAESEAEHAYALYVHSSSLQTMMRGCRLRAEASTVTANAVRKNTKAVGLMWLTDGLYSDCDNLDSFVDRDQYAVYALADTSALYNEGYAYAVASIAQPPVPVCSLYDDMYHLQQQFYHIEDALAAVSLQPEQQHTIVVTADCLLPAGDWCVPFGTQIVVPYADLQTAPIGVIAERTKVTAPRIAYVRLTLDTSAILTVKGKIEVSAEQLAGRSPSGQVYGPYGQLHLRPHTNIVLDSAAVMTVWGYVTGTGTIDVKAGATIYENLQLGDWKGANVTFAIMGNSQRVFPISHYFYQNIETTVVYHNGSKAFASTSEIVSEFLFTCDRIGFVGSDNALFRFESESTDTATWVRKYYDPYTDRMTWTLNGNVSVDKLDIVGKVPLMGSVSINSTDYILPFTANQTFVLQNGHFSLRHDVAMLPSSVLMVDSTATLTIPSQVNIYFYGNTDWQGFNGKRIATVAYTPEWSKSPRDTTLTDAHLYIGGTVIADGQLLSTKSACSFVPWYEDKGEVRIGALPDNASCSDAQTLFQLTGIGTQYQFTPTETCTAQLLNADSTFTSIQTTAQAGDVFRYHDGSWTLYADHSTATSLDNAAQNIHDSNESTSGIRMPRKVIMNGRMFILMPDGGLYDNMGRCLITLR